MRDLTDTLDSLCPLGWRVNSLSRLVDGWHVALMGECFIVTATGESIEDAIERAAEKVYDDKNYRTLFSDSKPYRERTKPTIDLLGLLGKRREIVVDDRRDM